MLELPKFYISACSNAAQLVPLHPILISILFHHYKELTECIFEVEQIETKVNSKKRSGLTIEEEEGEGDSYNTDIEPFRRTLSDGDSITVNSS